MHLHFKFKLFFCNLKHLPPKPKSNHVYIPLLPSFFCNSAALLPITSSLRLNSCISKEEEEAPSRGSSSHAFSRIYVRNKNNGEKHEISFARNRSCAMGNREVCVQIKIKNIPATSTRQKQAMRDFSHRFEANIMCVFFYFYFYVTQSCILWRDCVYMWQKPQMFHDYEELLFFGGRVLLCEALLLPPLPIEGKKGERYLSQRSGEKEKNVFVQKALRCVLVTGYGIHTYEKIIQRYFRAMV